MKSYDTILHGTLYNTLAGFAVSGASGSEIPLRWLLKLKRLPIGGNV